MTRTRAGDAGLSLIEVLVSLAIFAIIGVAGLAILNTVALTGERTEGRLERLAEIDRAFLIVRRDLAQIAPVNVMLDADGLAFRRTARSSNIAVTLLVKDMTFTRQVGEAATTAVDQKLLSGTSSARWRLLDGSRVWHRVWPPAGGAAEARPHAAELTIEVTGELSGETAVLTRLFPLPAGQGG